MDVSEPVVWPVGERLRERLFRRLRLAHFEEQVSRLLDECLAATGE